MICLKMLVNTQLDILAHGIVATKPQRLRQHQRQLLRDRLLKTQLLLQPHSRGPLVRQHFTYSLLSSGSVSPVPS